MTTTGITRFDDETELGEPLTDDEQADALDYWADQADQFDRSNGYDIADRWDDADFDYPTMAVEG